MEMTCKAVHPLALAVLVTVHHQRMEGVLHQEAPLEVKVHHHLEALDKVHLPVAVEVVANQQIKVQLFQELPSLVD